MFDLSRIVQKPWLILPPTSVSNINFWDLSLDFFEGETTFDIKTKKKKLKIKNLLRFFFFFFFKMDQQPNILHYNLQIDPEPTQPPK